VDGTFVFCSLNNVIRRVSNGIINTVAGISSPPIALVVTGPGQPSETPGWSMNAGYNGDGGPATLAFFYGPQGVAGNASGSVVVADVSVVRWRERLQCFKSTTCAR
jgi:hypothetical protein